MQQKFYRKKLAIKMIMDFRKTLAHKFKIRLEFKNMK